MVSFRVVLLGKGVHILIELVGCEGRGPTHLVVFFAILELVLKWVYLVHSLSQELRMLVPSEILRGKLINFIFSDPFQHLLGPLHPFDLGRFQVSVDELQLLESLSSEGVCNELPKLVEVDREAVISEDGLKVGREENSVERTVDKDLLELKANPRVKFGGTAPSSVV